MQHLENYIYIIIAAIWFFSKFFQKKPPQQTIEETAPSNQQNVPIPNSKKELKKRYAEVPSFSQELIAQEAKSLEEASQENATLQKTIKLRTHNNNFAQEVLVANEPKKELNRNWLFKDEMDLKKAFILADVLSTPKYKDFN